MGDIKVKSGANKINAESEEILFYDQAYPIHILQGLRQLKDRNQFCDVTLVIDGQEFQCHKAILAASSNYFNTMFTCNLSETTMEKIEIRGIDISIFNLMLNYAYSSEILINRSNVQNLLSASNLLQFTSIRDACCNFLKNHIDETNCIGIHCFAEAHNCTDLQNSSKIEILNHFLNVTRYEEFLTLDYRKLLEFLSDDELNVYKEEDIFNAALIWLNHDLQQRKLHLSALLSQIRLVFMDPYFIYDVIEPNPVISSDPNCLAIINQAKTYMLLKPQSRHFPDLNVRPRKSFGLTDIIIITGGEDDKVVLRGMESYDPLTQEWKTFSCLPFAISKHGLVSSGRYLYMAGGEFPDGITNAGLWRYEFYIDVWQELPSMSHSRTELGLAMLDGKLYAIGGWDSTSTNRLASIETFDPEGEDKWGWKQQPHHQSSQFNHQYQVHQNHHQNNFVINNSVNNNNGNNHPTPLPLANKTADNHYVPSLNANRYNLTHSATNGNNNCCIFNNHPSTSTLYVNQINNFNTSVKPLPEPLSSPGVVTHNGLLYVMGGAKSKGNSCSCNAYCYDPKTDVWSELPQMPLPKFAAATIVLKDRIYIIGGYTSLNVISNSVECYDITKREWINTVSDMREKRARAGVAAANGKIYIFGGEENWEKYHRSIEEYDPNTNEWKMTGSLPSPRGGLTCLTIQIKKEHYDKFKSIQIE